MRTNWMMVRSAAGRGSLRMKASRATCIMSVVLARSTSADQVELALKTLHGGTQLRSGDSEVPCMTMVLVRLAVASLTGAATDTTTRYPLDK